MTLKWVYDKSIFMFLWDYLFNFSKILAKTQQVALETLPIGVLILDSKRRFFYANETFRTFFKGSGWLSGPSVGKGILDGLKKLGGKNQVRGLFPIVKIPKEISFKQRILMEVFYHIPKKDGIPECFVGIFEDITDRKKTIESLHQTKRLSTLSQLMAGVAHEFNNPLAIIQTHLQLLRQDSNLENHASFDVIEKNISRLSSVLETVRSIYRETLSPSHFTPLGKPFNDAIHSLREEIEAAHISLVTKIQNPLPKVNLQPEEARQLLVHLLLNAKEAVQKRRNGDGGGKIIVRAVHHPEGGVILECKDNGIGIPKKIHGKIFEPFFTTKPVGKGMGLGLSMIQAVVHQSGGNIKIKSHEKTGTAIRLHLPPPPPPHGEQKNSWNKWNKRLLQLILPINKPS